MKLCLRSTVVSEVSGKSFFLVFCLAFFTHYLLDFLKIPLQYYNRRLARTNARIHCALWFRSGGHPGSLFLCLLHPVLDIFRAVLEKSGEENPSLAIHFKNNAIMYTFRGCGSDKSLAVNLPSLAWRSFFHIGKMSHYPRQTHIILGGHVGMAVRLMKNRI